jgi:ABC-2 type transport system permease protein
MNPITYISNWFRSLLLVWRREFKLVFSDPGVLLFFFALPTLYPLVYTIIYNPEVVRNMPVAIVDNDRSVESRHLVRMIDANPSVHVMGYATDLQEARRWMNSHDCYGIVEIPENYSKRIGRGEQAVVPFYAEMSLLLRYRGLLSALTDISLANGAEIRATTMAAAGLSGSGDSSTPVKTEAHFMGDPEQGMASFVIPGILVLILQQSIVLGVTMLGGGAAERRRRNGGIDPLHISASASATAIGKALCYLVLYFPLVIYILYFIPEIFSLPHNGHLLDAMLLMMPMLIASIFMGMLLQAFVKERETSLLVIVFTSVIFLFLSGLTWPRYAMNRLWIWLGNCIPATWGVEGFIRINSNGGTLAQNAHPYTMLWVLVAVYFVGACCYWRYISRPSSASSHH